jgi:hypothetical protein
MVIASSRWPFVILISLSHLLACASYTEETREIRSKFRSAQYGSALEAIEKSSLQSQERNRLLYNLEKGMIYDRMGKRKESRSLFQNADRIVDELYTVSISKTAASFIVNDSMADYGGEDYEQVAIHTMLALSFLADGDYRSARVEAKKINQRLYDLNQKYDSNKNRYAEDAFALYLSGLIFEAQGDFDDAIIDYRKALGLYEGSYKSFYRGNVPSGLVDSLYALSLKRNRTTIRDELRTKYQKLTQSLDRELAGNPKLGSLVVIHEYGHIANKIAKDFVFPFGRQIIRFSWPSIEKRSFYPSGVFGVSTPGDGFVAANHVQNMDEIARFTLDDRRARMLVKGAARLLAKGQLTEQAYKNLGPIGGIAANVFSAVTETADTRSWTLLPESFYITRARLKTGRHKVTIQSAGKTSQIVTVDIEPEKLKILRDFSN